MLLSVTSILCLESHRHRSTTGRKVHTTFVVVDWYIVIYVVFQCITTLGHTDALCHKFPQLSRRWCITNLKEKSFFSQNHRLLSVILWKLFRKYVFSLPAGDCHMYPWCNMFDCNLFCVCILFNAAGLRCAPARAVVREGLIHVGFALFRAILSIAMESAPIRGVWKRKFHLV